MGVRWDVALRSDGSRVWIWESRGERLFCPECEGEMIPVKGPQTRHHFRHKVADCPGESAIHWAKKYEVADALEGLGTVMVERKSGEYIPDVLFKDEWFFEVAFSNLPSPEKLEAHRERLVVFNFKDRTVWAQDEDYFPQSALFDGASLAEIVKSIGRDIISGEMIEVCSECRQVQGLNSQLFPGGRCRLCFFGQEKNEREIEEGATRYRFAKMR